MAVQTTTNTALVAGTPAPDFSLPATPDQLVSLPRLPRPAGDPRLLSRRLEPGLRRPDGALQRDSAGIPSFNAELLGISVDGAWCHVAFARSESSISPCSPISSRRGEVARRYGVYRERETARASARCSSSTQTASSAGATCRRPASTRAPTASSSALEALERGGCSMSDGERARLTLPVSARDHVGGTGDRHGHAGRIRRLRVSPLRPRLSDRQENSGTLGSRLRFVFRNFPLIAGPPACATRC